MAIAKATCTCKTCGKIFEVRATRNNRSAAASFEAWAAESITECPECRADRKEAEQQAYAEKVLAPYTLPTLEGSQKQIAWAEKLRKKALLKWIEWLGGADEVDVAALQWVISRHADCRWWIDNRDELNNQDAALELLGKEGEAYEAEVLATPAEKEATAAAEKEKQERIQRELEELGPIPAWPESIAARWPKGAKWNRKIYGGSGRKAIYLSGDKMSLTDGEAEALEAALTARDAWRAQKASIENH